MIEALAVSHRSGGRVNPNLASSLLAMTRGGQKEEAAAQLVSQVGFEEEEAKKFVKAIEPGPAGPGCTRPLFLLLVTALLVVLSLLNLARQEDRRRCLLAHVAGEVGDEHPQVVGEVLGEAVDGCRVDLVVRVHERVAEGGGILEPDRKRSVDPSRVGEARHRVVVARRRLQTEMNAGEHREVEHNLDGHQQVKGDDLGHLGSTHELTGFRGQDLP